MRLKPVKSSLLIGPRPREGRAILPPTPGIGARHLTRRLTLETHRLFVDEAHVLELMNGAMRVIERNALPKIASRLVERLAEDPGAALNIGAEIVSERPVRAPVRGNLAEPYVVDLHRADVDGAIRVLTDGAEPSGFDAEQEHQHAGGHMMNFGRRLQTSLDHRLIGSRRSADSERDRQRRERRRGAESPSPPIAFLSDARAHHAIAFLVSLRAV